MAHQYKIIVAALAAALAMCAGGLQVSAAEDMPELADGNSTLSGAATETETTPAYGWVNQNGKLYYILPDGSNAVGETEIDGVPYLFGFSGALKTDWQTIDDKRYYYDPATGELVLGWVGYFDNLYYVTAETGKLTGFQEIDGERYAFSEDGVLYTGEFYVGDVRYFASPENGILQEGLIVTETEAVVTDAEGAVVSGWYETEDGKRFYNNPETGQAEMGLVSIDGAYYFISPEEGMARGIVTIDGAIYPFDEETGELIDGWFTFSDGRYYFDSAKMTVLKNLLYQIDESWYYFSESGAVKTGWQTFSGCLFWFDENGAMYTSGILEIGEDVYLFDEIGHLCYGWQTICEQEYYFCQDGTMAVSETVRIGDFNYTFDENGLVTETEPASDTLTVVDYKQKDEQWADVRLGTSASSTIGKVGCLVTSMAMLHSYTTGEEVTPLDMKDMLSFTSGGALSSWNQITDLGYTVETYSSKVTSDVLMQIYVQLQAGCPVVLGSKGSGGQHYVIVTGYVGDGVTFTTADFTINDPGYTTRFYLSDHLAQYSTLYKLIY